MRFMGQNILAIIVAAIVIYLLEYLIFAVAMTSEQYTQLSGYASGDMSRMPYGALMPILAAIGLSLVVKWRGANGAMAGAMTGALIGILFGFSNSMYGYVYGPNSIHFELVELGHYVVCYGIAGAILAAWK